MKMKTKAKEENLMPKWKLNTLLMAGAPFVSPLFGPLASVVGILSFTQGMIEPAKKLQKLVVGGKANHVNKEMIDEIFRLSGLKNYDGETVKVNVIDVKDNYCDVYLKCPLGVDEESVAKKIGVLSTFYRNRCYLVPPFEDHRVSPKDKLRSGFGVVHVRIYTTQLSSIIPFRYVELNGKEKKEKLVFYYGKSRDGYEKIDLSEGHILIAGETGSGKSVLLHVILLQLMLNYSPEELEIEICDFKEGVEFNCYENCQHVSYYSTDYSHDSVKQYLEGIFSEMKERNAMIKSIPGCTKLSEYNQKCEPNKRIPRKLVVLEEMVTMMDNKEIKEEFGKLSSLARNAGIHIIGTTQRPSRDVISSLLKCNMAIRFGLLTADENNSKIIIDMEGCEKLKGKGNGILKHGSQVYEFQAMYVTNPEIYQLVDCMKRSPHFKRRNWRTGEYEGVDSTSLKELLNQPDFIHTIEEDAQEAFSYQQELLDKIR